MINLVAEKGVLCLPARVDEVLVDIFYYLEKSAKRKEALRQFQEIHDVEFRKILKYVPTQWLSLGKCLTRVLDQWKPLLSFLHEVKKDKESQLFGIIPDLKGSNKASNKASNSCSRKA